MAKNKDPWDSYDSWRTDVPKIWDEPTPEDLIEFFPVKCPECHESKRLEVISIIQLEEPNEVGGTTTVCNLRVRCKTCNNEWTA